MVGRCRTDRLDAFPAVSEMLVDTLLTRSRPEGLDLLCVGYGRCDLLRDSCDWHAMRKLAREVPGFVRTVHFYDEVCSQERIREAAEAIPADFESVPRAQVVTAENELDDTYDFIFYFGTYEPGLFDLPQLYFERARHAFVGVRMPGWGMMSNDDYDAARGVYMERHLDFPPERAGPFAPMDDRMREITYDMQDRPVAYVDVFRREDGFERSTTRVDRDVTGDDLAFRTYLRPEKYEALIDLGDDEGRRGGARRRSSSTLVGAACVALTSIASIAPVFSRSG